ncbi:MAG TPA: hypothetical protein VFZ59_24095 [Verrucomicrobiae bacterium]|nr:hypothetical protein [Verrucomicrobiae bacterium]
MRNVKIIALVGWLCVLFLTFARAITFELADGTRIEGEIVQGKADVLKIRVGDNKYEDIPWEKLSQGTLKQLAADPKLKLEPFVQPFIEIPEDERIKKTEVEIKPVPRLERPAKGSLIGAMFSSSVGLVVMLLLYAANIYAAYEIAVVRAYPAAMVCGISAVAPVIGPIIFLCMPTKLKSSEEHQHAVEPEPVADSSPLAPESGPTGAPGAAPAVGGLHVAHAPAPAATGPEHPQPQIFKRGQFTFNRRFIETKFSGFFGMVRHGAEKDLVLVIKSGRGEFVATRISRIAANDMHVDVHRGGASQEVQIPFLEIQEIQIKHKDA